jgi:uracil-DNA glycosylase
VAPATDDVIAALDALREEVECCSACALGATRTKAVFGEGDPGADLMFVGEAPGYHEDQQGRPFVGQAGRLLEQLLASIGLTREQVYIANVLKSRPPNNRDPRPEEIEACRPYLFRQIEIIKPKVICTLGNFATKLLTGNPAGITRVHGQPQETEIAGHTLYLYPIFHPAAALYTPSMLDTLKDDFSRLPRLLGDAAPGQDGQDGQTAETPAAAPAPGSAPSVAPDPVPESVAAAAAAPPAPAEPALEDLAREALDATPVEAELSPEPAPGSAPPAPAPAGQPSPDAAPAPAPAAEGPPAEPEQLGLF